MQHLRAYTILFVSVQGQIMAITAPHCTLDVSDSITDSLSDLFFPFRSYNAPRWLMEEERILVLAHLLITLLIIENSITRKIYKFSILGETQGSATCHLSSDVTVTISIPSSKVKLLQLETSSIWCRVPSVRASFVLSVIEGAASPSWPINALPRPAHVPHPSHTLPRSCS